MLVWLEMLRRGKHRGRRFEDVAAIDRGYCAWVLREKALPLHPFYRYLIKAHGGILNVGKHKGRYFDEVLEGAPEYCEWALNLKEPHETLHMFIDYLRVHAKNAPREASEEPPKKKSKLRRRKQRNRRKRKLPRQRRRTLIRKPRLNKRRSALRQLRLPPRPPKRP